MRKIVRFVFFIILLFSVWISISDEFLADDSSTVPPTGGHIEIIDNPKVSNYKIIKKDQSAYCYGELILVNNKIPYQFKQDSNLVSLYDVKNSAYKVKDKKVLVDESIVEPLNNMMKGFYEEYGINSVIVVSGYRTYDYQQDLYDQKVSRDGAVEARKWVAKPGASEHHTGYAIDFSIYHDNGKSDDYTGKGKYKWINDNAYKYGFIVRYPDHKKELTGIYYEPWHFRYVGQPHSFLIAKNDMCLEEYIEYLKQFEFGKRHLRVTQYDGKQYEIYFTRDHKVPVPRNRKYRISGNNVDGFIVTVEIQ